MKSIMLLIVASGLVLAGCGERPQALDDSAKRYAGKLDAKPWAGEAPRVEGRFTKGDKASWEAALRSRAQNQNEYVKSPS